MNKEGFNQLVSDYSKADQNFQDLENLVSKYPYSQPVRMLHLKSSTKLSKVEFQKRLGLAAFYSTDRNVLRSLIEDGKVPSELDHSSLPTEIKPETKTVGEKKLAGKPTDVDTLRNEVLANLEALQKNKANFLELTEGGEVEIKQTKKGKPSKPKTIKAKATPKKEPKVAPSTSEKSIRQSIQAKPKATRSRSKKDDIIDKFISEKPSITPNKKPQENQSDLSKPSSVLKEDLVSENLAIIFANQGKTTKAIEIYKKLIWKFPQKKASFAARIEELKQK